MAALCVTLAEHITYGQEYAKQIIANAQALGGALAERGFNVNGEKFGFTKSHTLSVDVREHGGGREASDNLEAAHVICNKNMMPGDKSPINPSGLRFGSQELTRLGMKENDMDTVAEVIKKVVIDKVEPAKVAGEVAELRKQFNTVHYCFRPGEQAHKLYELFPDWN
jgi:glycine hydroxymethyltransferase